MAGGAVAAVKRMWGADGAQRERTKAGAARWDEAKPRTIDD
jgi:hypothetical protein